MMRSPGWPLVAQPLRLNQAAASQSGWLRGGLRTLGGSVPLVVARVSSSGAGSRERRDRREALPCFTQELTK